MICMHHNCIDVSLSAVDFVFVDNFVCLCQLPVISHQRHSVSVLTMYSSVCLYVIIYYKFLNTISYKLFVGISPYLQNSCSWKQR